MRWCSLGFCTDQQDYIPDVDNQYVTITPGQTDPNYDEAGNLATDHRGYTYSYDHDNRQ